MIIIVGRRIVIILQNNNDIAKEKTKVFLNSFTLTRIKIFVRKKELLPKN